MKKGVAGKTFLFFAFVILIASPFVFAGFSEWWTTFTGRDTDNVTNVSIIIGNGLPGIYWVQPVTGVQPTESYGYDYYIAFNATDPDGASNLNVSTARIRLTNSSTDRDNVSCIAGAVMISNTSNQQFNCTVHLEYWDQGGIWQINASIDDINGATANNISTTFLHDVLHAITITPTSQTWASLNLADKNVTSDEGHMNLTNTGNDEGMTINVTAYNLRGTTTTTEYVYAENFSIGYQPGNEAGCNGTQMINATSVGILGASIPRGQGDAGKEPIYWCVNALDVTLSSQIYNSTFYGPWNVSSHT